MIAPPRSVGVNLFFLSMRQIELRQSSPFILDLPSLIDGSIASRQNNPLKRIPRF